MPANLNIKLTENDFLELAAGTAACLSKKAPEDLKAANVKAKYSSLKNDEERLEEFRHIMSYDAKSWEYESLGVLRFDSEVYPDLEKDGLPVEIRNASDIKTIQDYIDKNGDKLSFKHKAMLISRADSIAKQEEIQKLADEKLTGNNPFSWRPKIIKEKDGIILDIDKDPRHKTSRNGCWSVSFDSMLRSRGIKGVTQENIRSFRPKLGDKTKDIYKEKYIADVRMNRDNPKDITSMSDNALAFAPDTMLRIFDIKPPNEVNLPKNIKEPLNTNTYFQNTIKTVKNKIIDIIENDRSPIAITLGSHYITIVGLKGDYVYYLETNNTGTVRRMKSLSDIVSGLFFKSRLPLQLVWMSDIKLAKDGQTLYNVPSTYLKVNKDGTLKHSNETIFRAGQSEKSLTEFNGTRVRMINGIEDTTNDKDERSLINKDGLCVSEQAYIPNKLNMKRLRYDMRNRSDYEEKELLNRTISLVGKNPTLPPLRSKNLDELDSSLKPNISIEKLDVPEKRLRDSGDIDIKNRRIINSEERVKKFAEKIEKMMLPGQGNNGRKSIIKLFDRILQGNATYVEREGFKLCFESIGTQLKSQIFIDFVYDSISIYKELGEKAAAEYAAIKDEQSIYGFEDDKNIITDNNDFKKIADYSVKTLFDKDIHTINVIDELFNQYFQGFNKDDVVTTRLLQKGQDYTNAYEHGKRVQNSTLPDEVTIAENGINHKDKLITFTINEAAYNLKTLLEEYKTYENFNISNTDYLIRISDTLDAAKVASLLATVKYKKENPLDIENIKNLEDISTRETQKNADIDALASDIDMTGFLTHVRNAGFKISTPSHKLKMWNEVKSSIENRRQLLMEDNDPVLNIPGSADSLYSLSELQTLFKEKLDRRVFGDRFNYFYNLKDAAELTVLNYLISPGAKRMFYGKGLQNNDGNTERPYGKLIPDADGKYKKSDILAAVKELRDSLLKDQKFMDLLSTKPKTETFYAMYTDANITDINNMLREDENRINRRSPLSNPAIGVENLSDEEKEYFIRTKDELDTIYRMNGKFRSDYMKNIYNSLTEIVNIINHPETENNQFGLKLNELKSNSLKYYKERRGMIFSPLTSRGQQRLEIVENLAAKTDKVIKKAPKRHQYNL